MEALPVPAQTVVEQFVNKNLHGSTPGNSLEWWYLTGHLWENETCDPDTGFAKSAAPPTLGIQYTTFYSGAGKEQGTLLHTANSDPLTKTHEVQTRSETYSDGKPWGLLSRVNPQWLDNIHGNTRLVQLGQKQGAPWQLSIQNPNLEFTLELRPQKMWLHGDKGFASKIAGKGNVYVTIPFVPASGFKVALATQKRTEICGSFWFDHEVGVQQVDKVKWNWFAIRFASGKAYMIYDIRAEDGKRSLVGEVFDSQKAPFKPDLSKATSSGAKLSDIKLSEGKNYCLKSGNCYPQQFTLSFLDNNTPVKLDLATRFEEQEIKAPKGFGKSYWEGMATVKTQKGETGEAYIEMTQ